MDLEKIASQVELLRQRRLALPEIRDYKPQSRGKAKPAEPVVDAKPAEEIFAGLFTTEEPSDDNK